MNGRKKFFKTMFVRTCLENVSSSITTCSNLSLRIDQAWQRRIALARCYIFNKYTYTIHSHTKVKTFYYCRYKKKNQLVINIFASVQTKRNIIIE